jgi:ketosteroid isomerase-like protein
MGDGHSMPTAGLLRSRDSDKLCGVMTPENSTSGAGRTPAETFHALIEGVSGGPRPDLADLYADACDVAHPFHPERVPALRSREDLRGHFTLPPDAPRIERTPVDVQVHETADPEVVVGEFAYDCLLVDTGVRYRVPCVFVMRVRDGLIVESRDYIDHQAHARALAARPAGATASAP